VCRERACLSASVRDGAMAAWEDGFWRFGLNIRTIVSAV
jgi:hypothetical protein